jgi:2-oxo-4-hydroxy-4-carboxy--5-ureidoimidazoline (OHCU) decarboxylase
MHDGLQRITSQYHKSFILPFLMFCRRRHRLQEETTNR